MGHQTLVNDENDSTVCVATVTYGRRWHLLRQVLEELQTHHPAISEIVVVDNGSEGPVQSLIADQNYDTPVKVVRLDRNTGSANGFRVALSAASESGADLLWLLDDDNRPREGALGEMLEVYSLMGAGPETVLLADRPGRAVQPWVEGSAYCPGLRKNAFLDFHISRAIRRKAEGPNKDQPSRWMRISRARYGGLLVHSSLVKQVGVPNPRLYLYEDDVEYTLRLVRAGARIFLCKDAMIDDMQQSWWVGRQVPLFHPETEPRVVYYTVRNKIWIELKAASLPLVFYLNGTIFLVLQILKSLYLSRDMDLVAERLSIIAKGIRDAKADRLGKMSNRVEKVEV